MWARKDNGINDEWMMKNTTERERESGREGGSQGRIKVTWSSSASSTATLCGVAVDVIRGWGSRLGSFLGTKSVSTHKKLNIRQRLTSHNSGVGSRANKRTVYTSSSSIHREPPSLKINDNLPCTVPRN